MSDNAGTLAELLALNERIGDAESDADQEFFGSLLHARFTMRRPGGALSDRTDFISGLATGAARATSMQEVTLHGRYRATARCRVDKWELGEPAAVQVFDNLRVFIFEDGRWQLICWLAEPL